MVIFLAAFDTIFSIIVMVLIKSFCLWQLVIGEWRADSRLKEEENKGRSKEQEEDEHKKED